MAYIQIQTVGVNRTLWNYFEITVLYKCQATLTYIRFDFYLRRPTSSIITRKEQARDTREELCP